MIQIVYLHKMFVYVRLLVLRVVFVYVRLFKSVGERSFSPF